MGKDVILGALATLLILPGAAQAQLPDTNSHKSNIPAIQVTGTGSVEAKPDMATMSVGITTEDASAKTAVANNNAATAKVILELEASSVEKKDIRTSNFSIYPQYRPEGKNEQQFQSYRVSNTVTVTVHDLDKLGAIIAKAVGGGSNQIRGPNLQVSQPEKYLSEARKKAFENAMAKANTYASAAGLKLGSILEIVEEGASAPTYGVRSAGLAKSLSAVPVEAGEETLQAHVLLVVELKE